jgi:hypothetical protein
MPIIVACPGCGAKLNAPDSAAGKKVKCPKPGCGTVMAVPAPLPLDEDEPEQAPPPKPRKVAAARVDDDEDDRPRKKSRRDDDEEDEDDRPKSKRRRDEDDDDDDWKRKKKKRRQAAGGLSPGVIVAIAVGGLLVLGGIGYGVYALVSKKSDSASGGSGGGGGGGTKAAVPAGWVEYKSESDKFKAYFPETPQAITLPGGGAGGVAAVESVGMHMMNPKKGAGPLLGVIVLKFKPGTSAADKERAMAVFRQGMGKKGDSKISEPRSVTWAGQSAQELTIEDASRPNTKTGGKGAGVMRYMTTDTAAYIAIIGTENAGRAKPEEESGFFDNFELLK